MSAGTSAPYPATERRNCELAVCVREWSEPELFNFYESVLWRQFNLCEMTTDDVALWSIGVADDLAIVTDEIGRRERARQSGWSNQYQARSDALLALTGAIRDSVDYLVDLFEREDVCVARGRMEAHSPCPLCLGSDRFVLWYPPESHGWCRQCGIGGDVIYWARSFWQAGFAETVIRLGAEYLGLRNEVAT